MRSRLIAVAALALATSACTTGASRPGTTVPLVLHADRFGETRASAVRTLVIVLHAGEPDGVAAARAFATRAATAAPGTTSYVLLRPGHADAAGNRSPGDAGAGHGDDFDRARMDVVASDIAKLRARYPQARTMIVGDRGGAVLAANLAGLRPGLVDAVLLAGCPCSLPEWRRARARADRRGGWAKPVASLDPLQTAGGASPALFAGILVSDDDPIYPARFARSYAEALALRGIATDYRVLSGTDSLLGDAQAIEVAGQLIASLPAVRR